MAIRSNARVLRAKIEATYAVDPVCAAGDEVRCWGLVCRPKFEGMTHDILDATPGGIGASISQAVNETQFSTYLTWENAANGNSATPGELDPLFKASGWQVAYTPEVGGDNAGNVKVTRQTHALSTGNGSSVAFEAFEDASKRLVLGARGGWSATLKRGEPGVVAWKYLGKHQAPTSVAIPVTSIDLQQPPTVGGANVLSLTPSGGAAFNPKWLELTLDSGNTATAGPSGNDAQGVDTIEITETKPASGTITIVRELEATHAWEAAVRAETNYALALSIGSVVQNRLGIAAPLIQFTSYEIGNDSGRDTVKLGFVCKRVLAVGGDDLVLTFT